MSLICILKRLLSAFIDASCHCGKLMKILCVCRNFKKWIVTVGQMCNFRDVSTLYCKHSFMFANRKYEELSYPKNQKM